MRNVYEHFVDKFSYIPNLLDVCGADERYICDLASDFEKFRELCKIMPSLYGNPKYFELCAEARRIFGEGATLCEEDCEAMWISFCCGEQLALCESQGEFVIRVVGADELSDACLIRGVNKFIKPDLYHARLAREKLSLGKALEADESDVLAVQTLRERAQACQKAGDTLVIDAADASLEITCQIIRYLDQSGLLPRSLVMIGDTRQMCESVEDELEGILAFRQVSVAIAEKFAKGFAHLMPIGRGVIVLDETSCAENFAARLLSNWASVGYCPEKCVAKTEKYQLFG